MQCLTDENFSFVTYDFNEHQVVRFALRGNDAHRTGFGFLPIRDHFDGWDDERPLASRSDRVQVGQCVAFCGSAIDRCGSVAP